MLSQDLIITYSNQKIRELKRNLTNPLTKVQNLNTFINDFFEKHSFKNDINRYVAISFLYKVIKTEKIEYFDFIQPNSDILELLYDFILKINGSKQDIAEIFNGYKYEQVNILIEKYQEFKEINSLVDYNDKIKFFIENFEMFNFSDYENIIIDSFEEEGIKFYKSSLEKDLIDLLNLKSTKQLEKVNISENKANLLKLTNQPFDINEEVQAALKLTRKLLEENESLTQDDICIVTTDIDEYAPIYRLYLNKYDLKGYDSKGLALNLYHNKKVIDMQIKNALTDVENEINSILKECEKYSIKIDSKNLKDKLISNTFLLEEKIGIELTEANQLVGLNKKYKHLIFIGADINHFPPKRTDNFLYSSDIAQKYFCENSYYESSVYQYNELKRIAENLYILYPKYQGKRELSSSIIIDKEIPNEIDILNINDKKKKIQQEDFLNSILSQKFTKYDGVGVLGLNANHLSASQLGSYAKCPLKYLYNYKLGIKKPKDEEEGFDVMQQGTLMHSCFETFSKRVQGNTDLKIEDFSLIMQDVLEYEYKEFINDPKNEIVHENIYHQIFKYTLSKGLQELTEEGVLSKFILEYANEKDELNYFANSEFEKEFALDKDLKPYTLKSKDDKNYFIKGYIDRFDNLKEKINIVDYKSKKANNVLKEKLEEIKEFKDFQLGLYTLYASQEYKKEVDAYLQTFKTDKNLSTKFARISTNQKFIPQNKGRDIGILYDINYEEQLKSKIYQIKEKIEQGDFIFDNSDEKYCGYCEIKNMCNQTLLEKGIENGTK